MSTVTFQSTTLATVPAGTTVDLGSGAAGSGTQRVILATDQSVIPISDNSGSLTVDNAGTFAVQAAQSGNWPVRLQDGSGNAITSATRGAERAASVQIVDSSGNQITSFGGSGGTASNFTSAFPASGTAVGFNDGTNMQGARVFDADTGAGTQYLIGVNLRASGNGGSSEIGTAAAPVRTDPTGTTTQPVSGTVAATQSGSWSLAANQSVNCAQMNGVAVTMGNGVSGTGVQRVTIASDSTGQVAIAGTVTVASHAVTNAGTFAVQNNAATPTGTNAIGTITLDDVGTGWSISAANSAASTNATSAKGSAGRLHGYSVFNSNASPRYLKIYNKASAPTVGSDTPFMRVLIPAGGGANAFWPSPGITMGTGIAWALTTGAADSDSGAVAANEIQVQVIYS